MSVCEDPSYTCSSFGVKEQLKDTSVGVSLKHTEDRVFTLTCGSLTIPINTRQRSYEYNSTDATTRTNGRVIIVPDGFGTYEVDCFDYRQDISGTITEDYTTTDCTFHYADLRTDLFVYTQSIQQMAFTQTVDGGVDESGKFGNLVYLDTGYNDVWRIPFILEEVPITVSNKIICTGIGEVFSEDVNSGYWNGIRVLMPLFDSGDPRCGTITIDGTEYAVCDVDWYYIPNHRIADGDSFFWWADWHKAVGVNHIVDAEEALKLSESYLGYLPTPATLGSQNGIITTGFDGSAAENKGVIFFSATFRGGELKLAKIKTEADTSSVPSEKVSIDNGDGTFTKIDSEHTCYYPIAPL